MPINVAKIEKQLREAHKKNSIIRFARPFEPGTLIGYVMQVGPKFFVLAALGEGFEFTQHIILRLADVRRLESPAAREFFYKAAREMRADKMPPRVKIKLTDQCQILRSLDDAFVAIHFENISPGSVNIGWVTSHNKTHFEFLEIDSWAKWSSELTYFRLNEITRIDLPGPYEKALLLVGGPPPKPYSWSSHLYRKMKTLVVAC